MGYKGQSFTVPMGVEGLSTDDNQGRIPFTSLIRAKNISLIKGVVEKEPGSRRWNLFQLPAGIAGLFDWFPSSTVQRQIVVTKDGVVRRFLDAEASTIVTASGSAPTTLTGITNQVTLVAGGSELAGRERKLFVFSQANPIQVISGDATIRTNIATPTADWSMIQPTYGLIHRGRLVVLAGHRMYLSTADDHENFTGSGSLQFSVFPGDGEALMSGYVFRGRLFLFKGPTGVYFLDDQDPDPLNWGVKKLSSTFGAASPHAPVAVLNDLYVANSTGSVTSLTAAQEFGDINSGDILRLLRNEGFMRDTTSQAGTQDRHSIYYENKKLAMFTYRSAGGIMNDRIMYIDYNLQNPRVTWSTKDQANCLAMKKDSLGIERPIYGAEDGYIYEMDREDREVNGVGYMGEFQTPHMDFGSNDPGLAEKNKLYDFLEVTFEETGNWDLLIDVFVDREYTETINFTLTKDSFLNNFYLNQDSSVGRMSQSFRIPLHGSGRRISLRCYNSGVRQNFKIAALTVYFRLAGEAQKG